jgi:putative phage-type endonuclease
MVDDSDYKPSETESSDNSDLLSTISIEKDFEELCETDIAEITMDILHQIEDYIIDNILDISSPKFYDTMIAHIADTLLIEWEYADISVDEETELELKEYIELVLESHLLTSLIPKRSRKYTTDLLDENGSNDKRIAQLYQKIAELERIPQPKQKSKEWFDFRYGLISASVIWKALGSDSQVNSLIYEKCKPMSDEIITSSTESAMHWGVKYEPVTVMIYEDMFSTKVGEFGCIRHPKYHFIGASPDGINIDPSNPTRYGRMLEIKNIVNRQITGIPKEEYWIQTQVQMETCDLDECDFMETRFLEYMNEGAFYNDTEREYRGVILHFIEKNFTRGSQPLYKYMPLDISIDKEDVDEWVNGVREEMKTEGLVLFNRVYWYLEEHSCVLIQRNREWFERAVPKVKLVWETIEKERVEGYEHRASKKRGTKPLSISQDASMNYVVENMPLSNSICLVKLDF